MYQMIVVIMFYNHVIRIKIQKESDFLDVQILIRTFNRRDKSQNNGGGIPTDMIISGQPKAIESINLLQQNVWLSLPVL